MISTILFILSGALLVLFLTLGAMAVAAASSNNGYIKVTVPLWPLMLATLFAIVGVLL